jgi:hypothetical protein
MIQSFKNIWNIPELRRRVAVKLLRAAGVGLQATPMRSTRINYLVDAYLSMLMDLRGTAALQGIGIDATEESFQAAELARAGSVPRTVAAAAARSQSRMLPSPLSAWLRKRRAPN